MAVINLLNLIVCVIFFNPILSRQIQKLAFKQKLKYLEGIHCPFKKKTNTKKPSTKTAAMFILYVTEVVDVYHRRYKTQKETKR